MKRLWLLMIGVALLAVGCRSLGLADKPTLGQPVQTIVQMHSGQGMEYFDKDGNRIPDLSTSAGSVSIHSADRTGQDNYTFDANGVITRHQRSYGEDYSQGIWSEAK